MTQADIKKYFTAPIQTSKLYDKIKLKKQQETKEKEKETQTRQIKGKNGIALLVRDQGQSGVNVIKQRSFDDVLAKEKERDFNEKHKKQCKRKRQKKRSKRSKYRDYDYDDDYYEDDRNYEDRRRQDKYDDEGYYDRQRNWDYADDYSDEYYDDREYRDREKGRRGQVQARFADRSDKRKRDSKHDAKNHYPQGNKKPAVQNNRPIKQPRKKNKGGKKKYYQVTN